MKRKKYNVSLSSLYNDNMAEGYGRLRSRATYTNSERMQCRINVPAIFREFVFKVGRYEGPQGHTKAMGVLAKSLPARIFSSIEGALSDEKVFNALMDGPIADLTLLGMTAMECRLINFGLDQVSQVLETFYEFKGDAKSRAARKSQEQKTQAISAAGGLTLAGILSNNQTYFYCAEEEKEKITTVTRSLRIEKFKFQKMFSKFKDKQSEVSIDQTVFHFENFFGHYYENQEWDVDKLQEDIDIIMNIGKKIKSMASTDSAEAIYRTFTKAVGVRENRENLKILESLSQEIKNTPDGSGKFEKKLLNMLLSPNIGNDSSFYGRIIHLLVNNRYLNDEFTREIKQKINLLKRDISLLIS